MSLEDRKKCSRQTGSIVSAFDMLERDEAGLEGQMVGRISYDVVCCDSHERSEFGITPKIRGV